MKDNFEQCLALVLKHEGGWVNHPADPGGETMMGVTKKNWETYIGHPVPSGSMKNLTVKDVTPFYRANYWNKIRGDQLPDGVDFAVFDYAVNSGVSRAARQLQACAGLAQDGLIGPKTLEAVQSKKAVDLCKCICDNRLAFLKSLKTWPTFGKGWSRRVADVKKVSTTMAE